MKKKLIVSFIQIIIVFIISFSYNFFIEYEVTKMNDISLNVYKLIFISMLGFLIFFQNIFFTNRKGYNMLFISVILLSNYFIFNKNFTQAPLLSIFLILSSVVGLYSNIWIKKFFK